MVYTEAKAGHQRMGMYAGHFDFSVPLLWTVADLLSAEECAALLAAQGQATWLPATVNAATGRVVEAQVRNSHTAIVRDSELAARLYLRALAHVPPVMIDRTGSRPRQVRPVGLYLPLRIYRYEAGQHFGLHQDQSYKDARGRSLLTFMVYLNDGFRGGATVFPEREEVIRPRTGMGLLFQHMLLHAGERVTEGIKYVLRTDVVYGEGSESDDLE